MQINNLVKTVYHMQTSSSIQKPTLQGTHFSKVAMKKAQKTAIVGQVHVNIHHFSCT